MRGMDKGVKGQKKESEGRVAGVRDKKREGVRGTRWRKVNGVGKQDADYAWINPWRGKEGGENTKEGWHNSTTGVQPGMTERPIAPKDHTPAGRPAHPRAFS